ncbi:unnamed protein product [Tuber melanosporum]|uniref:(Perigord truffle) hypothetical protein n=1 Tax=Tuber melanosporum (strain Mel28) TaxID=656061 RepID=D5GJU1_TUBMM|nr:uncharacterized protein GSTUM_00009193001 [Tuber melanosporum]CAZ84784.1 unnamed protein product [Tuber melanosporum]
MQPPLPPLLLSTKSVSFRDKGAKKAVCKSVRLRRGTNECIDSEGYGARGSVTIGPATVRVDYTQPSIRVLEI